MQITSIGAQLNLTIKLKLKSKLHHSNKITMKNLLILQFIIQMSTQIILHHKKIHIINGHNW